MPDSKLTRLICLPNLEVIKSVSFKRYLRLHCSAKTERPNCPCCGGMARVHQYLTRSAKHMVVNGRQVTLIITFKRYRCSLCRMTFNEQIPGLLPRKRLTEKMQREIYWACENFKDLKRVRKHTTCGSKTIYERYYKQLELKQRQRNKTPWPKSIGIDEHAFNKNKQRGHRNFVTMIVDHNNKKPRELLPTRNGAELSMMLAHIPGRENVRNVTMDLSGPYRSFAKSYFPNAKIIADHFHVVRLLHPTINRMRKQVTGDDRKHPLRKLLLKNGKDLNWKTRTTIRRWLENHPELRDVYTAKEAMHTLYRCRGYRKAKRSLTKLLDWLAKSKVKELQSLRKTLMRWKTEILNFFENRLTNARTEGLNNIAKSIIKSSYGFKNVNHYRLRVLNV